MINLKLALLATGAVGAITAGGVAYATVSNNSPAPSVKPVADGAKKAVQEAAGGVPTGVPTCVSVPKGKLPNGKLPKGQLPENKLPKGEVPKPGLPTDKLPKDKLPKAELPKAGEQPNVPLPTGKVPTTLPTDKVKAPNGLPTDKVKAPTALPTDKVKVPANLPTCAPNAGQPSAASAPTGVPTAKPGLPKANVPDVTAPDCSAVPPVIKVEHNKAKDVTLPNGMHLAASHSHSVTLQSGKVCTVVQKFTATGGNFLNVERLNTPPQTTVKELAAELKLPEGGGLASVAGAQTWESPAGTGVLWITDQGYAVYLNGSPALATQLPAIATQLNQLH
ncbi:hypothetical protein [Actinoallomurus sp. CA-150999]|uniref:hypothetical protein n=1 Tax=Actinoallomurus sp. CA-150999 TaxID=3239887 RepID=UPI003D8F4514